MAILINEKLNKYQELIEQDDKKLEIKQIESEQRAIIDRMIHLELQKQRLQNLLNVLQSVDSEFSSDDDDQSL